MRSKQIKYGNNVFENRRLERYRDVKIQLKWKPGEIINNYTDQYRKKKKTREFLSDLVLFLPVSVKNKIVSRTDTK